MLLQVLCFIYMVSATLAADTIKRPKHIGLFMNTGPYSHDVMMLRIADELAKQNYHITLLQIRVFNFNMSLPESKNTYSILRYDYSNAETFEIMRNAQEQIWYGPVPYGGGTINRKGIDAFRKLYEMQTAACEMALRSADYLKKIQAANLDLIVIDHVLNECALGIASILNIPRIYVSNYPIIDVYAKYIGVPSNPSYVPTILSPTSSRMTFLQRTLNAIVHGVTILLRTAIVLYSQYRLRALGYQVDMLKEERNTVIYGTPVEFLLDGPRPIARNIKYFGCIGCSNGHKPSKLPMHDFNQDTIIASFGTCTSAAKVPDKVLQSFAAAFAQFNQYKVLLQIPDITVDNGTFPANVVATQWIPLLDLLGSPSVKLLISHGGVSTTLEAVNNAVPVLGIPLQGDQMYNIGRLVEKGVADVLYISSLSADLLSKKLKNMLPLSPEDPVLTAEQRRTVAKYRRNTVALKSMLSSYQSFEKEAIQRTAGSTPAFWVGWAVRHFNSRCKQLDSILQMNYPDQFFSYFMWDVLFVSVFFVFTLVYVTYSSE